MLLFVILIVGFLYMLVICKELQIKSISQFVMSRLRKKKHLNVDVWKRRSIFVECAVCESLKDLMSKARKNNPSVKEHEIKLKKHKIHQKSCRRLYHS
jgi:hypothetical protein